MKSTGIVRKIDELGRIVLPIELRRTHNLSTRDSVEIFTEGERIIITKYEPACIFCGESRDVVQYRGKNVCSACMKDIAARQ